MIVHSDMSILLGAYGSYITEATEGKPWDLYRFKREDY